MLTSVPNLSGGVHGGAPSRLLRVRMVAKQCNYTVRHLGYARAPSAYFFKNCEKAVPGRLLGTSMLCSYC